MEDKTDSNRLVIFNGGEIRRVLIDDEWFFSVVDVVGVLSESPNPNNYWKVLKNRLIKEGSQSVTNCNQLRLVSKKDGKKYLTDVADTETLLRVIQSVPSKKAEPFKKWLARVGKERIDEIEQPAKAIERAKSYYLAKGYSPEWVQTRIAGIETRHTFTDSLKDSGINESYQYAILTDELYKSSFGFTSSEYREYKGIGKKDSLRDNMTPMEIASTIFSEATSTELIQKTNPDGFFETKHTIHIAGSITKKAINEIERRSGKKVVTHKNAKGLQSPETLKKLAQKSNPETEDSETD